MVFRVLMRMQLPDFGKKFLTIGELCKNGTQVSDIVKRLLCFNAMPKGDSRGKQCCYGECDEESLCKECVDTEGFAKRIYRNNDLENKGWKPEDKMTYTSYSNTKGGEEDEVLQMSLLVKHRLHPSKFIDYFSKLSLEYCKHMAKLYREKHAHKEQERNFLVTDILVDIDFSQNFVYTDRKSAVQSDHWKSSSVTIFVCVVRFLSILAWNSPPINLKKGAQVSVVTKTNDEGGIVYVYGEVIEDQLVNSSTIRVKHPSTGNDHSYPFESVKVRKIISVPVIIVSDSKLHDTYFVRYFLLNNLLGPDGWLRTYKTEPGLKERIKRVYIDSDGAAAHFKQRGSILYIAFLCIWFGLFISWTFGCPGHGKGTWDGLGGILKNTAGHYMKAMDSFLSNGKEVFDIIFELFGSENARLRFANSPHVKIKEWIILWLSDEDIIRPKKPIEKKLSVAEKAKLLEEKAKAKEIMDSLSRKDATLARAKASKEKEAAKTLAIENGEVVIDESNQFSKLEAFHNVGVRHIFYYQAEHRDGLSLRLSACHCHFCIRGFRKDGFGTMNTGCLSQEPCQYLVCQRIDDEWIKEKAVLMARLSIQFRGKFKSNSIIALASDRLQNKSSSSFFCAFDIAKVVDVKDGEMCTVNFYSHEEENFLFTQSLVTLPISISQSKVRHILSDDVLQQDGTVLLDKNCVEKIVFNCFNGVSENEM